MSNIENTPDTQLLPQQYDGGPTILDDIDPELTSRLSSRRMLLKASAGLGALAAAPILMTAASSDANALFGFLLPQQIIDVLNFALTLEHLEARFYSAGLNSPGLIPRQYQTVFQTISTHESQHVVALTAVLGLAAKPSPEFDFTAGGRYPDVFRNFRTFAKLSQTFEDLGVAAYKGQAPRLISNDLILTTALRIHSIEARHAAEIRRVRGAKPWTGAFDSPLSKSQVLAAATPFIVGG